MLTLTNTESGTGRFFLNFGTNSLSNDEFDLNDIQIFANSNKEIHVRGDLKSDSEIQTVHDFFKATYGL